MKFDCGETWEEKKARLSEWHDRFAWLPTRVDDHDCRWLETIERKGRYVGGFNSLWIWEYRGKK